MKSYLHRIILLCVIAFIFSGCFLFKKETPKATPYPEWAKNCVIYETNTRQYSAEGTFKALQADLPRIKELGIDVLWLMPIYPIGEKNRKKIGRAHV